MVIMYTMNTEIWGLKRSCGYLVCNSSLEGVGMHMYLCVHTDSLCFMDGLVANTVPCSIGELCSLGVTVAGPVFPDDSTADAPSYGEVAATLNQTSVCGQWCGCWYVGECVCGGEYSMHRKKEMEKSKYNFWANRHPSTSATMIIIILCAHTNVVYTKASDGICKCTYILPSNKTGSICKRET